MTVPSVSVLVPVFDFERYVVEALESVIAQQWPADRLQVVVVDNGSTDATPQLLARYADRFDVRIQPAGPVNAMVDTLLEAATGEYLTFISGDDVWPAGRLAHLVGRLEARPECGMAYGDMEVIDGDSQLLAASFFAENGMDHVTGARLGPMLMRNLVPGASMLIRSELKRAFHPIPPQAAWEDWWMATCIARVAAIDATQVVTCRYRAHDANLAHGASGEKLERLQPTELRFRRWALATVSPGDASPEELQQAVAVMIRAMDRVSGHRGVSVAACLELSERDREAARAAALTAQSSCVADAPAHWCRAVAHDPITQAWRDGLMAALEQARRWPTDPIVVRPDEVLPGARSAVTLAFADELVADPRLLVAYAAAHGPDDDATLAIYAPDADPAVALEQLGTLLGRLGLDGDDAPDMQLVARPGSLGVQTALAVRADALLGHGERGWPFAALAPALSPLSR